jgi:hypothetical protein
LPPDARPDDADRPSRLMAVVVDEAGDVAGTACGGDVGAAVGLRLMETCGGGLVGAMELLGDVQHVAESMVLENMSAGSA